MPEILHVTTRPGWEQAVADGEYRSETLAAELLHHCCLSEQLAGVVSRYFAGQTGLVVLRIATERLTSPMKWESPPGSDERFPHVYGPLNVDAVAEVVLLEDVLGR